MRARSAVFDLYGDHLLSRDGWAPVAAVVQLTGAVGVAPAATRTAISRIVREGWLEPQERHGVRGYAATGPARKRLEAAGERIYARTSAWDGTWHLVTIEHTGDRSVRDRTRASMKYLGYAPLAADTWLAPRRSADLDQSLAVPFREFTARYDEDPCALAAQLWDLQTLATEHARFRAWLTDQLHQVPRTPDPEQAYRARTTIVHEWRKFLFTDPGLPQEALPDPWPGHAAAAEFRTAAADLQDPAAAHVDSCIRSALPKETS